MSLSQPRISLRKSCPDHAAPSSTAYLALRDQAGLSMVAPPCRTAARGLARWGANTVLPSMPSLLHALLLDHPPSRAAQAVAGGRLSGRRHDTRRRESRSLSSRSLRDPAIVGPGGRRRRLGVAGRRPARSAFVTASRPPCSSISRPTIAQSDAPAPSAWAAPR